MEPVSYLYSVHNDCNNDCECTLVQSPNISMKPVCNLCIVYKAFKNQFTVCTLVQSPKNLNINFKLYLSEINNK